MGLKGVRAQPSVCTDALKIETMWSSSGHGLCGVSALALSAVKVAECTHKHMHSVDMCVWVHVHVCACAYVYVYACLLVCKCVFVSVHVCARV